MLQPNKDPIHFWERLYKNEKWKTPLQVHPSFRGFISWLRRNAWGVVVDVGCGVGRHLPSITRKGYKAIGVDVSQTALATGKSKRSKVKNAISSELIQASMANLPLRADKVAGIVCTNVIHHDIPSKVRQALEELRRILKKGGGGLITLLSDRDFKFGRGERLGEKTFKAEDGIEAGVVHTFFNRREIRILLEDFRVIRIKHRCAILSEGKSCHWDVTVIKQ